MPHFQIKFEILLFLIRLPPDITSGQGLEKKTFLGLQFFTITDTIKAW
jgi:hypothetical protein